MPRSAILLDFDGTLADSLPLCVASHRAALLRHTGRIHSDREIVAHFGISEEGILRRLVPADWRQAVRTYEEEYERSHAQLCPAPFPGVPELLADLRRRGVRTGIITGKGRPTALISLRRLGLLELIDEVRAGSPTGDVKAEQIAELLQLFQVAPGRAAYLGDTASDVRASRASGVQALAAAWAPGVDLPALEAERPDALFRAFAELPGWVDGWLAGEGAGARAPLSSALR